MQRYSAVTFNDAARRLAGRELIDFLRGHDRAITGLERLNDRVFAQLPELRVISKYGIGLDMIDLEAMVRHGVRLGWTGGTNKRAVSELVISCTIAVLRKVPRANLDLRTGTWYQHQGRQISGKCVGIIGCGHIGKDLAVLLKAFGCRVLANDILDFAEFYARHGVEATDLESLLRQSDVVTLHVPLDASTRNILSAERLALMKPDAVLINAARGGLVDEVCLKEMLKSGRLAGAALDVFAVEPPEDPELLNLPNVLATPHIGGSAEEAILAVGRAAIDGLDNAAVPGPDLVAQR